MANCKYCPKCGGELVRTEHGKKDMKCLKCKKYFTYQNLCKKTFSNCLNCGKEIAGKRQFCSVECYAKYLRRNNNERKND